jgi:predicted ATPase/DNA-binding SARP family transcriptional activator
LAAQKPLEVKLLGELEVARGGLPLALPQSKKTRALLAYLVLSQRAHRRERLCSLLWDVTDDPRGALRWSLSKLRSLVDEKGKTRIVASRESIAFDGEGAHVDLFAVRDQVAVGVEELPTKELDELAGRFRGELLEGLELPDFHEFQAWCAVERENARGLRRTILGELVRRRSERPEEALPFAHALAETDPLNEAACATLVRLLVRSGRRTEALRQLDATTRMLQGIGCEPSAELLLARRELGGGSAPAAESSLAAEHDDPAPPDERDAIRLVGRKAEIERLIAALDHVGERRRERVMFLTGEPGVGKTRLLAELATTVRRRGGTVLEGSAYEAECSRPYGPWTDALRRLPAVALGESIAGDLAPLLPERAAASAVEVSRDRLFGAVVELVAARAHSKPPVLFTFDDVQWCDEASAELLHYVARLSRYRPVLFAMAARGGELADNPPILRMVRSLRHEHILDEMALGPLSREETAELIEAIAPGADGDEVYAESAGNPLFAIELARSAPHRGGGGAPTLNGLVRDRIERLPASAAEVVRWAATVGQTFSVRRLNGLTSVGLDQLLPALEVLERYGLLRALDDTRDPQVEYAFAHDVVRRVVYADLSEPRRRLMHLRIARALTELGEAEESIAADIVHHAALAGEPTMAARACVSAGRRCLRLFANGEAEAFARRGLDLGADLAEPERTRLTLELIQIRLAARRPPDVEPAARAIEALAERALDHGSIEHARLGFHMLSYLRWEGGQWSDAQHYMMRAEQVSRSADEKERVIAMAEAARCLALLERDLGHAEAMLLEASALSQRLGISPVAVPDAIGMLRLHQGRLAEAVGLFAQARDLARREGDRLGEFHALENLVMLELQRHDLAAARALADEMVRLGERLREGSEAPFARALAALTRYGLEDDEALVDLERAVSALRLVDDKYRLAYALTRAADVDLRRGRAEQARARAEEAKRVAEALQRPTEIALANVALTRALAALGDVKAAERQRRELECESSRFLSAHARAAIESLGAEGRSERSGRTS